MSAKSLQLCLFAILWTVALQAPLSWDSPGKNTGVGCHLLLQGIFPTQGSSSSLFCLLHWQVGSLPLVPPGERERERGESFNDLTGLCVYHILFPGSESLSGAQSKRRKLDSAF